MKIKRISSILLLLLPLASFAQDIQHKLLLTDPTIEGPQNIHILEIELNKLGKSLMIDMLWSDSILYKTSHFASNNEAIAAINGGFFNIRDGGSVTFL